MSAAEELFVEKSPSWSQFLAISQGVVRVIFTVISVGVRRYYVPVLSWIREVCSFSEMSKT